MLSSEDTSRNHKFIAFEAIDCAGKTTTLNSIKNIFDIATTREPGGTDFGCKVRHLILTEGNNISREAESMLFYVDRLEHLRQLVIPTLEHKTVVTDRYYYSTLCYQQSSFTDSLHSFLKMRNLLPVPDLTILFDIDIETYLSRKHSRGTVSGEEVNAIEDRDVLEYEKTLARFREISRENPDVAVIDARQTPDQVLEQVVQIFDSLNIPRL